MKNFWNLKFGLFILIISSLSFGVVAIPEIMRGMLFANQRQMLIFTGMVVAFIINSGFAICLPFVLLQRSSKKITGTNPKKAELTVEKI